MSDSYADHPVSLAEAKANKEHDGRLWTARDALIDLLRRIDSGDLAVGAMVVCYSELEEGKHAFTRFSAAYTDFPSTLGLLNRVAFMLNSEG